MTTLIKQLAAGVVLSIASLGGAGVSAQDNSKAIEVAAPVQNTTAPTSATSDVIFDTAINRCARLGFKRDTMEWRYCVERQISEQSAKCPK